MNRTTIFFSMAANFWTHTAVAASSVLRQDDNLDIHIFSDGVND